MVLENIIGYAGAKEIIDNFKFSGDWEKDCIRLSNALQRHYYDSVGVYNDGIQKAIETDVNAIIKTQYSHINFVVDHNGIMFEE